MENKRNALPNFTRKEEIFNAVTHIVGGAFGIFVTVFAIIKGITNNYAFLEIFSMIIYGLSLIILYTMSSIYHFLKPNTAKKVFRVFDHCTIYLLIAGTYTPICIIGLEGEKLGIIILIIEWVLALAGIIMNAIDMHNKYIKAISMVLYIVMGWCAVLFLKDLLSLVGLNGLLFILIGGILYTIGVVFFSFGTKAKYLHSIWHIFVLLGSLVQYLGIIIYMY